MNQLRFLLLTIVFAVTGCISSSNPEPPEHHTTVVVPQGSSSTTTCPDGTAPPCHH